MYLPEQSQTQKGRRYIPHLTRFFATVAPEELMQHVYTALSALPGKIKYQTRPAVPPVAALARIGGYDARREVFKGFIEIEEFDSREQGRVSLCVMKRDVGNPISWKQLWKAVVSAPEVNPLVLKKRR